MKLVNTLFLCFVSLSVCAKDLSVRHFLQNIKGSENTRDRVDTARYIKNVDLRVDASETFGKGKFRATLRLVPAFNKEYTVHSKINKKMNNVLSIIELRKEQQLISEIHEQYIELVMNAKISMQLRKRRNYLRDSIRVAKALVQKNQASYADIFKLEEEYLIVKKSIVQYKNFSKDARKKLAFISKTSTPKHFSTSIKLMSLKQVKRKILKDKKFENLDLKVLRHEYELSSADYELSKIEESRFFKHIDFSVEGQNRFDGNGHKEGGESEKIGIKIAFNLPMKGSKHGDLGKLIKKINLGHEYQQEAFEIKNNTDEQVSELLSLIDEVVASDGAEHIKDARKYLKILKRRKGTSPLELLSLQNVLLKNSLDKAIKTKDIFKEYILFLAARNLLDINKNYIE